MLTEDRTIVDTKEPNSIDNIADQLGFVPSDDADTDFDGNMYPDHVETAVPFHKKGGPKAALVALGSLAVVLGVMWFYTNRTAQITVSDGGQPTPANTPVTGDERLAQLQQESSQAQAQLALGAQQRALMGSPSPSPSPTPAVRPKPERVQQTAPQPRPQRVVAAPPPPVRSLPAVSRDLPYRRPAPLPTRPVEPQEQWQNLATLGRQDFAAPPGLRGSGAPLPAIPAAASPTTQPLSPPLPGTGTGIPGVGGNLRSSGQPIATFFAQQQFSGTALGNNQRIVSPGTVVRAVTNTGLVWAGTKSASEARIMLQSQEHLLDSNGQVVLPKGTILLGSLRPTHAEGGLAEVDINGAILNGKEYSFPPGSLIVRGTNGQPLRGKAMGGGRRARATLMSMFTSAISASAALANRPTQSSTSSFSSLGGSTSTVVQTTPPPNYAGAAAEAAFSRFSRDIDQNSKQVQAQLDKGGRIFVVPEGRAVEIFVNQPINL